MSGLDHWSRLLVLAWAIALGLGGLGYLLGWETLVGLSVVLRRVALIVTVLWLAQRALAALWRRVTHRRGGRGAR